MNGRRGFFASRLAGALSVLTLSACGKIAADGAGASGGGALAENESSVGVARACLARVQAEQRFEQRCAVGLSPEDAHYNEATLVKACIAKASAPGIGVTTRTLTGCAHAYDAADCRTPKREICAPTKGTLAPGAACELAEQCSSGWCQVSVGGGCGTCGAPKWPTLGQPCAEERVCDVGLYCDHKRNACVPVVSEGGSCENSVECGPGGMACLTNVCVRVAPAKVEECSTSDSTSGEPCDNQRGVCTNGRCVADPRGLGAVCDIRHSCKAQFACLRGLCRERPFSGPVVALGAYCSSGIECEEGASCYEGVCQVRSYGECP